MKRVLVMFCSLEILRAYLSAGSPWSINDVHDSDRATNSAFLTREEDSWAGYDQPKTLKSDRHITEQQNEAIDYTTRFLPYLDQQLWYNMTAEMVEYDTAQHQFRLKRVNVLKFKYEDEPILDGARNTGDEDGEPEGESPDEALTRRRRNVFGKDSRAHITNRFVEDFPFQTFVRLGKGCSGTLIWYKHVLTAAHCVHDRTNFYPPLKELQVGLLRRDGTFKWLDVKKVFVPKAWMKKQGLTYLNHDYAVLELTVPHGRRWMPVEAYDLRQNQLIQFAGFPADKNENEMWVSFCSISEPLKHVFLHYCDAAPGMSGSGVYIYNKNDKQDRKVVAVFSANLRWDSKKGKQSKTGKSGAINVAARLTRNKIRKICEWIGAGTGCYKINTVFDSHYYNSHDSERKRGDYT